MRVICGAFMCNYKTFFALALVATPALAMNGLRPIGVSAESNAMGGTGVSYFYNYYDALYKNPAIMQQAEHPVGQRQVIYGMTYGVFNPSVKATYGKDQEYKKPVNSTAGVFPSAFGAGTRVNQRTTLAVGTYGGGGGADYGEKADSVYRAKSRTRAYILSAGAAWAPLANASIGANASASMIDIEATNLSPTKGTVAKTGGKATTFGTVLGLAYQAGKLRLGAAVQPAQTANIAGARDIDDDGEADDLAFTAVPNEIAAGASWRDLQWMAVAEYRFLQWSEAEFLKAVGWVDQHVLAVAYEYGGKHRIRLGYNVSTDAAKSQAGNDGFATTEVSDKPLIKLAGDAFATTSALGVTNKHYTLGSAHALSQNLSLNTGLVYMEPGSLQRSGYYDVPTGTKQYGWKSKFSGSTLQVDMTYLW